MMLRQQIAELRDVDEIEKLKLKLEHFKAWTTLISILVSSIGVVSAIFVNMIIQERASRTNFELKAIEIVMGADSPAAATNKAVVLYELFPERLSDRFEKTLTKLYEAPEESAHR